MIDENALRECLKVLIEQAHWTAIAAAHAAKHSVGSFPVTTADVNAGFDRLYRLLESAVIDEGEQHDEDPDVTPAAGS